MDIQPLAIPDVIVITPKKFGDERGFFSETYNIEAFAAAGIELNFVQDNHSLSVPRGTLRGLHFQKPPMAQDKLVRCVRGSILDVAVDIRAGSPTYGQHVSAIISAENWKQILVPKGFAHAFLTLEPDTEVAYKVTELYSRECDANILWSDPSLDIDWGIDHEHVVLSDKDRDAPLLSNIDTGFEYHQDQ